MRVFVTETCNSSNSFKHCPPPSPPASLWSRLSNPNWDHPVIVGQVTDTSQTRETTPSRHCVLMFHVCVSVLECVRACVHARVPGVDGERARARAEREDIRNDNVGGAGRRPQAQALHHHTHI